MHHSPKTALTGWPATMGRRRFRVNGATLVSRVPECGWPFPLPSPEKDSRPFIRPARQMLLPIETIEEDNESAED